MSKPLTERPLSPTQKRAVKLTADGCYSNREIAEQLGKCRETITKWQKLPRFREQVTAIIEATRVATLGALHEKAASAEELRQAGLQQISATIARKQGRVAQLQQDWDDLKTIQRERAEVLLAAAKEQGKPAPAGASTGLVYFHNTAAGGEWRIDLGMLKTRMAIQEAAARELGQWVEKQVRANVSSIEELTDEEIDSLLADGARRYGPEVVQ
jgi:transposase